MPMIGPRTGVAFRHKRVTLSNPGSGDLVPDGDGGYLPAGPVALVPPQMWAHVAPVTKADLEGIAGGTVLATATHLVSLPYHPGVTLDTVLTVEDYPKPDRLFKVVYLGNPDERDARLDLICAEQL